jgi:galacturan 1,4-alpha-galacturonidase
MRSTIPFLVVSSAVFASSRIHRRATCTVSSLADPLANDVPAITAALQTCGHDGSIVLPENQTFQIRSPIDLSPCRRCNFQIDGTLNVSSDWGYWQTQNTIFTISNATNAIIDGSKTGTIDGNNFGRTGDNGLLDHAPTLFSISQKSYQVYVRQFKIKNVPGIVFQVSSGSNAIRFQAIDFVTPAETGYLVEQAQHVYVYNNTIRATHSCVSILPNSSNVQVEASTCITNGTAATSSGFELRFGASAALQWIRNVFVKGIRGSFSTDVLAFRVGSAYAAPQPVEITNVTFSDIVWDGRAHAAFELAEGRNALTAKDVSLESFSGAVQEAADLSCSNPTDVCDIEAKNWSVIVRG